jgi:hypothetical protein
METMLINKLKLAMIVVVVAELITLILYYPEIYIGAFNLGLDNDIIELVLRHVH